MLTGGRFIDTAIMSKDTLAYLESNGVEYATTQDAAQALLKLASDPSINGRYLHRLL